MLRSPAATPLTVRSSARESSGSGSAAGRGLVALALEERDLEVGDRVQVGVADGEGLLEDRVGVQELLAAGDAQYLADGQLVFGLDGGEDVLEVVGDEGVDVVAGDPQVGLREGHLDVGEEVLEEVPLLVHLVEHGVSFLSQACLAQGLEAGADAEPAGHDLP